MSNPKKLAQEIITEVDDRSRRARNFLSLNVKEPIENTSFRRRNADRNTAVDTINSLGISPTPKISRVHRIWKWSDLKVQCQPLLVEVESMHQRDEIIGHAHTLNENKHKIRIIGDYKETRKSESSNLNSNGTKSEFVPFLQRHVMPHFR